jgi:alpha-glucosidase (family GH31 glycosyl hydrolase)
VREDVGAFTERLQQSRLGLEPIWITSPAPRVNRYVLEHSGVSVVVRADPLRIDVRQGGRPVLADLRLWTAEGSGEDRLIIATEGVLCRESLEPRREVTAAQLLSVGGRNATLSAADDDVTVSIGLPAKDHVVIAVNPRRECFRLGADWTPPRGEHLVGLGARHGEALDQCGRRVLLGADRRYTGPDCPPELLEVGGIPQADCAPAPWLLSSAGYAVWLETAGAGTLFDLSGETRSLSIRGAAGALRIHLLLDTTPAARLRHYCRLTGMPALLPEWGYGHWKSRDVYQHQDDVLEDFDGYRWHRIPLDAIVIDSPWETQYNTWRFNPHQFPDPAGMVARMRSAGVRTVVWVTPWVNLDSVDGQRPPGAASEQLHREPAENYAEGEAAGHFVRSPNSDEPHVGRWWMGSGSAVDFTSSPADRWWRGLARPVLEMGVEGIKADDGEGYYLPPAVRLADGRRGADAAWTCGNLYRKSMQTALDEVHPGRGVLFGRSAWSGAQALGILWGGDQTSDFWSLRALVAATLSAAASGFSNWSHDIGGYLGERLVARCPKELLIRWVQFGCFTSLMHAHGRHPQEAWTYDTETLELYRRYVTLHERLVPYVRAAAATAARCGLPVVRPLCLTDPSDARGWTIADAYGYGPALWVAPVVQKGACDRDVYLPAGRWIDFWSGERTSGGRDVVAAAPLERIPVWVREGSLLVTYPAAEVAGGLGEPDHSRPLEATLWGEPALGSASARLADGTRIRWRRGRWRVDPPREVTVSVA